MLASWRSFDRATHVLLLNEFATFFGFFLIFPFLATYLAKDIALATWAVGLVLGLRVFCQQGLTIVGGLLGDRFGYKPVVMAGLACRTVGFGLFAVADSLWLVIPAAIFTGLAGAMFGPALRAYAAVTAGGRRVELFGWVNIAGQLGTVTGPVVGSLLLGFGFQTVCVVSALVFSGLFVLQIGLLPGGVGGRKASQPEPMRENWAYVLRNGEFLRFALIMCSYLVLQNQLFFGLPLELRRLTGADQASGAIFLIVATVSVSLQAALSRVVARWVGMPRGIALGMAIYTLAYVPVLVATVLVPTASAPLGDLVAIALAAAPILASAVLIGLASLIVQPFTNALVSQLSKERAMATHFGVYWSITGVAATLGSAGFGLAVDLAGGLPWLPWATLIVLGAASSLGMAALARRPAFQPAG